MKKENMLLRNILIIVMLLSPFLFSRLYLLPIGQSITTILPATSDEEFYYNQLKSALEYGYPIGYYGFAGSRALIGHFAAHGFGWVLPYLLGVLLTGLNYSSIAVWNHVLFAGCLLIVYKETGKVGKQVFGLALLYFVPGFAYYMNSCMMEGLNFIIGILAAILLGKLAKSTELSKENVALAGVCIAYFSVCKIMWAILWAPFFYLLSRRWRRIQSYLTIVFGTTIMVVAFYEVHILTASPYYDNWYLIDVIGNLCKNSKILDVLKFYFGEVKYNTWLTLVPEMNKMYSDIRVIFIISGFLMAVGGTVVAIIKKSLEPFIPVIVFGGYFVGTVMLYRGGAVVFRTIFPAFLFAITYIVMKNDRLVNTILILTGILIFAHTISMQIHNQYDDRLWYDENQMEMYASMMNPINDIQIVDSSDAWDNTLLYPSMQAKNSSLLYLPSGVGINLYKEIPENVDEIKAGWLIIDSEYNTQIAELRENGFEVYKQENGSCLLKKK